MPRVPAKPPPPALRPVANVSAAAEAIARTSHDGWVRDRLAEGWARGDRLDEEARQHPSLVPFAELPASERARVRQMAVASVETLAALGYPLSAPPLPVPVPGASPVETPDAFARQMLTAADAVRDLPGLLTFWRSQEADTWAQMPDVSYRVGERFVQLGEPLAAHDAAAQALKMNPGHVRLRQILALTLAAIGCSPRWPRRH